VTPPPSLLLLLLPPPPALPAKMVLADLSNASFSGPLPDLSASKALWALTARYNQVGGCWVGLGGWGGGWVGGWVGWSWVEMGARLGERIGRMVLGGAEWVST
jgi:hypothetical protein